jgi:hypothetical protein
VPVDGADAGAWLCRTLALLRQQPPDSLRTASLRSIWQWALENWQLARLESVKSLPDR